MIRCFELIAIPGDPVLIEPIYVALEESLVPGIPLRLTGVFSSIDRARGYLQTVEVTQCLTA